MPLRHPHAKSRKRKPIGQSFVRKSTNETEPRCCCCCVKKSKKGEETSPYFCCSQFPCEKKMPSPFLVPNEISALSKKVKRVPNCEANLAKIILQFIYGAMPAWLALKKVGWSWGWSIKSSKRLPKINHNGWAGRLRICFLPGIWIPCEITSCRIRGIFLLSFIKAEFMLAIDQKW